MRWARKLVLALFALGSMSSSLAAQVCTDKPKLVADAQNHTSLFLPTSVQRLVRSSFPGLRVPDKMDLKGAWVTEAKPGSLPYFTEGDFNGSGLPGFPLPDLAVNSASATFIGR